MASTLNMHCSHLDYLVKQGLYLLDMAIAIIINDTIMYFMATGRAFLYCTSCYNHMAMLSIKQ